MNKTEVLERGIELITGDREKNYGSTHTNFSRIAALWSVVLDHDVDPHQVALCLAQLKVARLIETSDHEDSWCDLAGYVGIGGELATELLMVDWEREPPQGEGLDWPYVGAGVKGDQYGSELLPVGTVLIEPDSEYRLHRYPSGWARGLDWEDAPEGEAYPPDQWSVCRIIHHLPMARWERELLYAEEAPQEGPSGGFEEPNVPKVGDWISTEDEYASLPIGSQLGVAYYPQDRASGSTDVFWQKHSGGWDLPDREDGGVTDASMAELNRARMILRVGAA